MVSLISAHRGLTSKYQENTVDGIVAASKIGVEMIEFDTMKTKDDVWILNHDLFLEDSKYIPSMRYEEISSHMESKGLKLDVLDDLISKVSDVHMNYELKTKQNEDGANFAEFLKNRDLAHEFNVSSFHRGALIELYRMHPEIKLSYLGHIHPFIKWRTLMFKIPLYSVNPYIRFISERKVKSIHKRGAQVHTFTVNEERDIIQCMEIGVDVIISDYPEMALSLRKDYENKNTFQDISSQ